MTRARAPWLLALGLAALTLATSARANDTQRLIVDAGLNLGLWQAQVELFGTAATDPSQVGYANGAYAAVDLVRQRLRPPFADLDLASVLEAIARYPERTADLPARQRAVEVAQIHDRYRARLAVAYLSTTGVFVASTCDAAFLDVGYHLGRAQMAAFAGDAAVLANARSMLLQAVRTGLDAARDLRCGFNLEDVWGSLGVAEARSLADYQALVEPIRRTADEAWSLAEPDAPLLPSDPARGEVPPVPPAAPGDLVGTWRFPETGIRIEFRAVGDGIVGTLHDLAADLRAVGYTEGMEAYRLRAAGDGGYVGAALVILSYQTFAWREELHVTVAGDVARFEERWDMGRANPFEARREP
jgi:hypothetical protein